MEASAETPTRDIATVPDVLGQDMQLLPSPMECATGVTAAVSSYYTYDERPWESLTLGMHQTDDGIQANISDHRQSDPTRDISNWDLLQHGFGLDDASTTDVELDLLDPVLRSPSPFLPVRAEQPRSGGDINISNGVTTELGTSGLGSGTLPGQRLLSLIAEMQQCLRMLEEGPWQHDSTRSLDEYPVGTVLHLSEEFASVAGSVLNAACFAVGMPPSRVSEGTSTSDGTPARKIPPTAAILAAAAAVATTTPTATTTTKCDDAIFWSDGYLGSGSQLGSMRIDGCDTSSTLLVLVGYTLLIHIYGIVLGHFQMHLSCTPCSGPNGVRSHGGSAASASTSTSPSLQLGELSYASAVPDLGRIHTAVCMLLAALRGVEDQLGRGGAVGRNLVLTLLTQEAVLRAGELQDGCGGLGSKVRSVKELLRERIGL